MLESVKKRNDFLPFHQYSFGEEEKNAVMKALDSGWITTGPKTKEFEANFSEYIGCKHSIALNSCTAGLHLSLVANNIKQGDEVLVPALTFTATSNVVVHCGATPILVDIEEDTLNIDIKKIEEKITKNTKAIIPVHIAGQPCKMDEITEIAKKHNLIIIEDAAHATESFYKNQKIGNISPITNFSFYATKNLCTAEGGMLTTNDDKLAEKIRVLSLHGLSKDAWKRYSNEGYKHYDVIHAGYKYNMTDIQSSMGIEQLKKIEGFLEIRNKHKQIYDNFIKDIPFVAPLYEIDNIRHARHLYIVKIDIDKLNITRDELMNLMIAENIGVSVHFIPIHFHSFYKENFGIKLEDLPVATKMGNSILSLPFYPKMKEKDIFYVCSKLNEIIYKNM
ncbi:MAG: DegT/DnrJ/EryC1/StrS family aminotransferase [Candidatus Sericytochromatia bacterium]